LTSPYQTVIDLSVAIVVFAVADLGRWGFCDHRTFDAQSIGLTDKLCGLLATAHAHRAALTERRKVLVDFAIAIVVDTVTAFCLWRTCGRRARKTRTIGFTAPCPTFFTSPDTDFTSGSFV
jgi:hypothetical protein